ncbi:MAG: phosphate acetyltransferase [Candidatus Omnitrophica bacterium]|nr:phosphate acetyltransferase [Candidatus Omnitrophota bacterium]
METIKKIRQKAASNLKTIILPEYDDSRVLEAAKIIDSEGIAKVLLLTPDKVCPKEKERYIDEFYRIYKGKDYTLEAVKELFKGTLYYAAMMTREGKADGMVAGASHTTPNMARAVIRCIGVDEKITIVSSCFVMAVPDCAYGEEGTFIFADCGVIPEPNARQLACISMATSKMAKKALDLVPRIAVLSYSTKGSAKTKSAEKIAEAITLFKEMAPGIMIDGEMQVDAAIVPEVAKIKYPESSLAGRANILIFPNLEAGNIGYKLVQRLGKADALGPLFLGLKKPASDLSRGCLIEDIVNSVALTAVMAQ